LSSGRGLSSKLNSLNDVRGSSLAFCGQVGLDLTGSNNRIDQLKRNKKNIDYLFVRRQV
jgi:hypothetical protein